MVRWCVRVVGPRGPLLPKEGVKNQKFVRVSGSLKLAARDEKDLSTPQSTARTHARLPRANGDAGRTQYPQAAAGQGSHAAGDLDPPEAAGLAAQARDFAFRATDRLHQRSEYLRTQRAGVRAQTAHFVIYAASAPAPAVRLGVTVARRIGGAVVRNRVKRRVRECFRLTLRGVLPEGTDLVVIARGGAGELRSAAIRDELVAAVRIVSQRLAAS